MRRETRAFVIISTVLTWAQTLVNMIPSIYQAVVVGIVGAWIGQWLPDRDLALPLLRHRDLLTHGWLLPAGMWLWARRSQDVRVQWFAIGFAAAIAGHLCFDLWPLGWRGFALIHFLTLLRLPPVLSWLWIAGSILVCVVMVCMLARQVREVLLGVGGVVWPFWVYSEDERVLFPLLTLCVAVGLVVWSVRQTQKYQKEA